MDLIAEIEMWQRCCPLFDRKEIEKFVTEWREEEKSRSELPEKWVKRWVRISSYGDYLDYLKSEEWHSVKTRVWARDGGTCQECGCCSHLQVHHLNYEMIGREWFDDYRTVQLLCQWCHSSRHGLN